MAHRFNGPVWSALHAGDAWFIGGEFDRAETTIAGNLVGLDLTGAATGCSVREGVSDATQGPASVLAMAKVGNALFIGGDFRKYRGQPANFIAKLDATTCALDTAFSPPRRQRLRQRRLRPRAFVERRLALRRRPVPRLPRRA
ncbi:MAG: hypothetical protein IAE78_00375 [Myxococcus sp.]|nr:hypothetical protein [Myxococcus sp.]